jgi:hypothetical protein
VEKRIEAIEYPEIQKVIIIPMMVICVNQNKYLYSLVIDLVER